MLRPERFVTQKVVRTAYRISKGSSEILTLGDMSISRDWGWAPEYVKAMWLMLQVEQADDFVIATGQSHSLTDFVAQAFAYYGLDWTAHVVHDKKLLRSNEIAWNQGDSSKAKEILGWQANMHMKDVVVALCELTN